MHDPVIVEWFNGEEDPLGAATSVVPHSLMSDNLTSLDVFLATRDEQVFRALYREHTPRMLSLALRLTGGRRQDAEDIVQDTWSRACTSWHRFRGGSKLSTWLCGIVVNCFREQRRAWEAVEITEQAVPPAENSALEQLVQRLPERCRAVLVLHDIEGHTHEEIGQLLGIAEGTSRHHLFRARHLLAEWLGRSNA